MRFVRFIGVIVISIAWRGCGLQNSQAGEPIFPVKQKPIVSPKSDAKPMAAERAIETLERVTKPKIQKEDLSGYRPWYVDGHDTPDSHLINDHGIDPSRLRDLTADEKNRLHGKMHEGKNVQSVQKSVFRVQSVQVQSGCPGGVCPIPGIRSRRRR